jgi:hypothetical protein
MPDVVRTVAVVAAALALTALGMAVVVVAYDLYGFCHAC